MNFQAAGDQVEIPEPLTILVPEIIDRHLPVLIDHNEPVGNN